MSFSQPRHSSMDFLTAEPEPLSPGSRILSPPPRYMSPTSGVTQPSEEDYRPMLNPQARPRESSVYQSRPRPEDGLPANGRARSVRRDLPSPPAPMSPLPSPPMEPGSSYPENHLAVNHRRARGSESSGSSNGHPPNGYTSPSWHPVRRASGEPPSPLHLATPGSFDSAQSPGRPSNHTARYSFSQLSWNSMILSPLEVTGTAERIRQAEYHISVGMNCFLPGTAFITTIRRGGSAEGEVIGEIEIGNPEHGKKGGTVRVGSTKVWLNKALRKGAGNHKTSAFSWRNPWSWEFPGRTQLLWNCSDQLKKCHRVNYTGGRDTTPLVASFSPPHSDDKDVVVVSSPAILEVAGLDSQETFDHVVISVLLLERKRLLPT